MRTFERHGDVYALFVDIMGFADSLEQLSRDEFFHLRSSLEGGFDFGLTPQALNVLSRYRAFHGFLHNEIKQWHDYIHTVIEFSDSAFVVLDLAVAAESLAVQMMCSFMLKRLPVRMGIGAGSFARMAFATSSNPDGLLIASAPFMGTSIVRAYRAQACKAKGLRIFLHPSAIRRDRPGGWMYVDLPEDECSESCATELSFVLKLGEDVEQLRAAVLSMRSGVSNPRALLHYNGTEAALARFVAAIDRAQPNR